MWWVITAISLYILVLFLYLIGEKRIPSIASKNIDPKTTFSVVIPFRNEANNLPDLLASLASIEYPSALFEIFLVNDASEDNSEEIITTWIAHNNLQTNVQLIQSERSTASPKKDAITTAVKKASYDWIVTTDADCVIPSQWLQLYSNYIHNKDVSLVAAPVVYKGASSVLNQFQIQDGLSLQAITMGAFGWKNPILANGANMAYLRETFNTLNGFSGNDHIASGDDIFMLEKVYSKTPSRVGFLKSKDAIVFTNTQADWGSILNQRIRWASKTSKQKSLLPKLLGFLILYVNLIVLLTPLAILTNPTEYALLALTAVGVKFCMDYIFLLNCGKVLGVRLHFGYFILSFCLYPFIFILVLIGSVLSNYSWKGRTFKR